MKENVEGNQPISSNRRTDHTEQISSINPHMYEHSHNLPQNAFYPSLNIQLNMQPIIHMSPANLTNLYGINKFNGDKDTYCLWYKAMEQLLLYRRLGWTIGLNDNIPSNKETYEQQQLKAYNILTFNLVVFETDGLC